MRRPQIGVGCIGFDRSEKTVTPSHTFHSRRVKATGHSKRSAGGDVSLFVPVAFAHGWPA